MIEGDKRRKAEILCSSNSQIAGNNLCTLSRETRNLLSPGQPERNEEKSAQRQESSAGSFIDDIGLTLDKFIYLIGIVRDSFPISFLKKQLMMIVTVYLLHRLFCVAKKRS